MKVTSIVAVALVYATGTCASPAFVDTNAAENDYPYGKSECGQVDKWNFYSCQSTSFVAWRINDQLGKDFDNQYKGVFWGNANSWDEAARKANVSINSTPKVGSVAQSEEGDYGHVAWVSAVDGDKITIEEYNYETKEAYDKRTVSKDEFDNYIHF